MGVTVPPWRTSGKDSFSFVGFLVCATMPPSSTIVGGNLLGNVASTAPDDGALVRDCVGSFVGFRVLFGLLVGVGVFIGLLEGLRVLRIRRLLFGALLASGARVSAAVGTAVIIKD